MHQSTSIRQIDGDRPLMTAACGDGVRDLSTQCLQTFRNTQGAHGQQSAKSTPHAHKHGTETAHVNAGLRNLLPTLLLRQMGRLRELAAELRRNVGTLLGHVVLPRVLDLIVWHERHATEERLLKMNRHGVRSGIGFPFVLSKIG
jgi:hypothetical protein